MVNFGTLTATALSDGQTFNWLWLVELFVCCILVLFFLFYFNRLFATLVSYGLRAYTWHTFHVYLDIQSLQISLLGGRIFFKGIRYHGANETILIQHGYLTWQYWLRTARQVDLARYEDTSKQNLDCNSTESSSQAERSRTSAHDVETGPVKKSDSSECRISLSVSGLEWFIYNRTPAYDAILENVHASDIKRPNTSSTASGFEQNQKSAGLKSRVANTKAQARSTDSNRSQTLAETKEEKSAFNESDQKDFDPLASVESRSTAGISQTELSPVSDAVSPLMLRILPIGIECSKGAISIGNENTRAILTTTFAKAKGYIDASTAGPQDIYRQLFDFEIDRPLVQMKPNPDYRQSQNAAAQMNASAIDKLLGKRKWWALNLHLHRRRRKAWRSLKNLVPQFRSSIESFHQTADHEKPMHHAGDWQEGEMEDDHWLGLTRYIDDDEADDHQVWLHLEYARFSTVLDCPSLHLTFYWDVPGQITVQNQSTEAHQNINGSQPPGYGLDLIVRGGNVTYGPWTDRLRAEIQNAFFPNAYHSSEPASVLVVGDTRVSTDMIIRVDIEEEITLRVPTRESSKDWQWKGRAGAIRGAGAIKRANEKKYFRFRKGAKRRLGPDIRPFGWLDFVVAPNSTVRYEMDMFARTEGYRNFLELDLKSTRVRSSVNHELLWTCQSQRLSCDLSNPLGWNSLHTWAFDIQSQSMELFLLRDHAYLLTDLINDFTMGPAADYLTFVPFHYRIDLKFHDLKLYLNANDSNIIDNPNDLEDNTFLILRLLDLNATVDIPMHYYSPAQSSVLFKAHGLGVSLDMTTPLWNTLRTFVDEEPVATLKDLALDGSYNFCSQTSPTLTDSLFMNITGLSPRVYLHGFLIRCFMKVKDNYFGDDMHFKTLGEYQESLTKDSRPNTAQPHAPAKKENDLDVILSIRADRSSALLPSNIYSRKENVRFDILLVEADMRFTNYYMDLDVKSSPIEAMLESLSEIDSSAPPKVTGSQLYIDGISAFGHRLFGAPPSEPTYVCNWDFDVGQILGECTTVFLRTLIFSIQALSFTLDDDENALPVRHSAVIHDITFLRARVDSIRIWLLIEDAATVLSTSKIDVNFNDWAGNYFSKEIHAQIPNLVLATVDRTQALHRSEGTSPTAPTMACFQTSVEVTIRDRKANFARDRALQQQHVRYHDQRTHRADWFLHEASERFSSKRQPEWARHSPAMPIPSMPEPIEQLGATGGISKRHIGRRSSFLSIESSKSSHSRTNVQSKSKNGFLRMGDPYPKRSSPRSRSQIPAAKSESTRTSLAGQLSNTSENGEYRASKGLITFASPWSPPYFAFQNVQPDMTELPLMSSDEWKLGEAATKDRQPENELLMIEEEEATHSGIFCNLPKGLTGFCRPLFFAFVAGLIREIQPRHPIDLLDSVQIDTMSRILNAVELKLKARKLTDIALRLPSAHIKLINEISHVQEKHSVRLRDEYEASITKARVYARLDESMVKKEGDMKAKTVMSLHAQANETSLAISQKAMDDTLGTASAECRILDLTFRLGTQQKSRAMLQIRSIDLTTWSSGIEYFASLIQRTRSLVESLVAAFENLSTNFVLRHLMYHLASRGQDAPDPVFLTRPSYVLRSAGHHLREQDSWKIVSRLRYLYQSAGPAIQQIAVEEAFGHHAELPENAQDHIMASFDKWRHWDHDRVESTPVMDRIFGKSAMALPGTDFSTAVEAEISIRNAAIVLDPGPKQNELIILDTDVGVSIERTSLLDSRPSPMEKKFLENVQVNGYFSQFSLNLNWDLVELVGDIMDQLNAFRPNPTNSVSPSINNIQDDGSTLSLSIVLGADEASISLSSINLGLYMAADNLRASAIHDATQSHKAVSSVVLSSTTGLTKVKAGMATLLAWKVVQPTIYSSFTSGIASHVVPNVFRLAATCERLRFDMKQHILEMLNVAERVINKEVKDLHAIVARQNATAVAKPVPTTLSPEYSAKSTRFHIALVLNEYRLQFSLLPTLRYVISGRVARTSVTPRSHHHYTVNVDLKHSSHALRPESSSTQEELTVLEVPPINGRVTTNIGKEITKVGVRTTFEMIHLEAGAVRAFIDIINRPEVARLIVRAKTKVQRLSNAVETIFGDIMTGVDKPNTPETPATISFKANSTFAGLALHCIAPGLKRKDQFANLDFVLGSTVLVVHNRTEQPGMLHVQPQFEIRIHEIELGIGRRIRGEQRNFGKLSFGIKASGSTEIDDEGNEVQAYRAWSERLNIDLYSETASLVTDVAAFLKERISSFTLTEEAKHFRPLRRLTVAALDLKPPLDHHEDDSKDDDTVSTAFFDSVYSVELDDIQARYILQDAALSPGRELEDLIFSIKKVDLKTKREGSARLAIIEMQLQMVPKSVDSIERTSNSALMPQVVFNVAYLTVNQGRRFAFQLAGKALDLRLSPDFIVPASALHKSLVGASSELREANAYWATTPASATKSTPQSLLGDKRLSSLLVDADFAGAVVNVKHRKEEEYRTSVFGILKGERRPKAGRYGQAVQGDAATEAILRAPGIAFKVEYKDNGKDDPTLQTEVKVAASSNVLYPSVVPLILEITSSIEGAVSNTDENPKASEKPQAQKYLPGTDFSNGDPSAILGRCKLSAGLWIQEQQFSLSCQPIARVAATARFDSIFMSLNTVQAHEQDRFFALLLTFNRLGASVQHVYSRESTASFEVESIVVSMMNSKHVTSSKGMSAILNISPMKADINAKQLQDFLLFREIWYPTEMRGASAPPEPPVASADAQALVVQRYQQVAAAGAFPWNAIVSIQELEVQLDLGPGLGKSRFLISKLWASTKKSSDWEQNLCVGFDKIGVDSTGRMSGFVELQDFHVRTSISWPHKEQQSDRAPLVQGSISFEHLRVKAAFDYQPFLVADISTFAFLMYNIHSTVSGGKDRLVGILDGDKIQVFCTTGSAAQGLALYQAFERLIDEKKTAYAASIRELDRYLRRKSVFPTSVWANAAADIAEEDSTEVLVAPFSLQTDVVLTLRSVSAGAFPTTFFDNQIFKVEITDAQARFAVSSHAHNTTSHSALGMTLGELRVALSSVSRPNTQALSDVSVSEVIARAMGSRGGTILKVPKVVATMQTWQASESNVIEYIFRSIFEGKVDVGWNYSRISFIRGMWSAHSRALAHRLGKPLPSQSAVKITATSLDEKHETALTDADAGQEKITAEINLPPPSSRYEYVALEPPVIDTPQLRDLGEATPSLEWIGLHRDRLPNVCHQVIIVGLEGVARRVEGAYGRILGG